MACPRGICPGTLMLTRIECAFVHRMRHCCRMVPLVPSADRRKDEGEADVDLRWWPSARLCHLCTFMSRELSQGNAHVSGNPLHHVVIWEKDHVQRLLCTMYCLLALCTSADFPASCRDLIEMWNGSMPASIIPLSLPNEQCLNLMAPIFAHCWHGV